MIMVSLHQTGPTNGKLLLQPRTIKSTASLKMEFDNEGRLLVANLVKGVLDHIARPLRAVAPNCWTVWLLC